VTRIVWYLCGCLAVLLGGQAAAHPLRTGYLEVQPVSGEDFAVRWTMPMPDGVLSGIEPVFDARCAVEGAVEVADTAMRLDRSWRLRCPGGLAGTTLLMRGLGAGQSDLMVRWADGRGSVVRLTAAAPSLTFPANGTLPGGTFAYVWLGIEHILQGFDHILFVLGLLLIVRGRWMLVKTITAFTVAHSITLAAAVLGFVRVPQPPLEAAIALSILCLGVEAARARRGRTSLGLRQPWLLAFAFGLLHGLGFAGALLDIGLPPAAIPLTLMMFNLGVELGQLLIAGGALLVVHAFRLLRVHWPEPITALPVYVVGSLGAYWTIDRLVAMLPPG
jgi:hydrogenase/urease accessory protein HupE